MHKTIKVEYICLVAIIAITNGALKTYGYLGFLRKERSVLNAIPDNLSPLKVLVL